MSSLSVTSGLYHSYMANSQRGDMHLRPKIDSRSNVDSESTQRLGLGDAKDSLEWIATIVGAEAFRSVLTEAEKAVAERLFAMVVKGGVPARLVTQSGKGLDYERRVDGVERLAERMDRVLTAVYKGAIGASPLEASNHEKWVLRSADGAVLTITWPKNPDPLKGPEAMTSRKRFLVAEIGALQFYLPLIKDMKSFFVIQQELIDTRDAEQASSTKSITLDVAKISHPSGRASSALIGSSLPRVAVAECGSGEVSL